MLKNKKLILVLLLSTFFLTACNKNLVYKKKPVKNPITSQVLTENILCRPTDKKILETYNNNGQKENIDKLPTCEKLSIFSNNSGIWDTFFVKPYAVAIVKVKDLVKNYGLSIVIITIILKTLMYPIAKKAILQSKKMQKIKPQMDKMQAKYRDKIEKETDPSKKQQLMMAQQSEMFMIYKQNDIHLFSTMVPSILQAVIFIGFYESIMRLPVIFESKFLMFNLGFSPFTAFTMGKWSYVIIVLLNILFMREIFESTGQNANDQNPQMKKVTNIMIIFISFIFIMLPTGMSVYMTTQNIMTLIQNKWILRKAK